MNHGGRVYELDTDLLLADLQAMLRRNGIDVREGPPAGVWWFHSDEAADAIGRQTTELFGRIIAANLREIEQ
jgi:hypothetical protein